AVTPFHVNNVLSVLFDIRWSAMCCRLADTYAWLKSRLSKSPFDPPAGGMKFVYAYALITLLGGGLFVGQQLLFTLPIKLRLIWESIIQVSQGATIAPSSFANGAAVLGSQVIDAGLLAYAYWRRPGGQSDAERR
ncbi:MAG: hypothetical protein JW850_07240, partial [Thermoflexales bacterium]|nr:hypothetical protein [Thermoflexales bacterium]